MFDAIMQMDSGILLWIQDNLRSDTLDRFMVSFTRLGNHGLIFIVLTLLALICAKTRRSGAASAIALLIGLILVSVILKPLVARPRPYVIIEGLRNLVDESKDPNSFPSGHTCAAFGLAVAWSRSMRSRMVSVMVYLMAVLMGFSRLYVAVHNPSDVIVGALCGVLSATIAIYILTAWENRKRTMSKGGK